MTTIDTTLYAGGELRLTDHGPRGGGIVLLHVASGRQFDLPYNYPDTGRTVTWAIEYRITSMARGGFDAETILEKIADVFKDHGTLH
jgi:hypothetical protein